MDKLSKLMALKKSGREMSPVEKKAKMDVLGQLNGVADEALGNKLKGLKKVTVASDSPEGLSEGLSKAKEMLHGKTGDIDAHEEHEKSEGDGPDLEGMADEMQEELSPGDHADEEEAEMHDEDPSPAAASEHEDGHGDIDSKIKQLMLAKEMRNRKVNI